MLTNYIILTVYTGRGSRKRLPQKCTIERKDSASDLFLDLCALADPVTQIVELRSSDLTAADNLNRLD